MKFLISFIFKGFRKEIATVLFFLCVLSLVQALLFFMIGPFFKLVFTDGFVTDHSVINTILEASPASLHPLIHYFYGYLKVLRVDDFVVAIPLAVLCLGLLRTWLSFQFMFSQQRLAIKVVERMRDRLFGKVLRLDFFHYLAKTTSSWVSLIINDVGFIQERVGELFSFFLRDLSLLISAFLLLSFISFKTALVFLFFLPVVMWMLGTYARKVGRYTEQWQKHMATISSHIFQLRQRFLYMRIMEAQDFEKRYFARLDQAYTHSLMTSIPRRSFLSPFVELSGLTVLLAFFYLLNRKLVFVEASPEQTVQMLLAVAVMIKPAKGMGEHFAIMSEMGGALSDVKKLWVEAESSDQSEAVKGLHVNVASPTTLRISKLKVVDPFTQNRLLFIHQNMEFRQGESTALIGSSGSGKSVFLTSLSGVLPMSEWQSNFSREDLKRRSVFVQQKPFIFEGSVRENLSYGAECAPSEIRSATERALIYKEIQEKPKGLDHEILFFDPGFSGGQLQRIALGRLFLRPDKSIWLCDEVTSALDEQTSQRLLESLLRHVKDKGRILIYSTHRMSELPQFDQVIRVENGVIVDCGRHDDLLKSSPDYASYIRSESSHHDDKRAARE